MKRRRQEREKTPRRGRWPENQPKEEPRQRKRSAVLNATERGEAKCSLWARERPILGL